MRDARVALVNLNEIEKLTLHLISIGLRDPQIAKLMSVSPETVNDRLGRVFHKLGARNRTQAVAIAIRVGEIS